MVRRLASSAAGSPLATVARSCRNPDASARSSSESARTTTCAAPMSNQRGVSDAAGVTSTLPTGHPSSSATEAAATTGIPSRSRHCTSFCLRPSLSSRKTTESRGSVVKCPQRVHRDSRTKSPSQTWVICNEAHCGQRCSISPPACSLIRSERTGRDVGSVVVHQIRCRIRWPTNDLVTRNTPFGCRLMTTAHPSTKVRLNSYGCASGALRSARRCTSASGKHLQTARQQFAHPLLEQRARVTLAGEMVMRIDQMELTPLVAPLDRD